jgi:hypothetical protein
MKAFKETAGGPDVAGILRFDAHPALPQALHFSPIGANIRADALHGTGMSDCCGCGKTLEVERMQAR